MKYHITVVGVSLLSIFSLVQGMEIKNWRYEERDPRCVAYYLLPKQVTSKKYPYFLPEKDESEGKRSFVHELMVVKAMEEQGILLRDVAKQILQYAYVTEKTLDADKMEKLEKLLNFKKIDFVYLPLKSKRALLYLWENGVRGLDFIIEGRDKEFARKMSQDIVDLPLFIKKQFVYDLRRKYMLCNTKYEPSLYNTLMGEDDASYYANRNRLARIAKIATKGAIAFTGISVLATTDLSDNAKDVIGGFMIGASVSTGLSVGLQVTDPDKKPAQGEAAVGCVGVGIGAGIGVPLGAIRDVKIEGNTIKESIKSNGLLGLGEVVGMFITEGAGLYVHNKVENWLQESSEERQTRLGFEKIYFLKDDEKQLHDV